MGLEMCLKASSLSRQIVGQEKKNPGTYDIYCADKWCKRKMQGEEQG